MADNENENGDQPIDRFEPTRYLAPRHWPTWVGLGLLRLGTALPYRWQVRLGAGLGRLLYHVLPSRRRITKTNIDLCFPDLEESQRWDLVRRHFRAAGISVFESGLAWWAERDRLEPLCHIQGMEHLRSAVERGKGVILLTAHFTSLEIGGRLLALHQPFQFMYKQARKNPLFDAVMSSGRIRHYERAVPHSDVRGMVQGLRRNMVCWYAPDQDFGRKNSVFAPFMGVQTSTLVAPGRFARMTGAAVVPYYPHRREDGSGYDIVILPPLEAFPSGDDVEDATRVNRLIEEQVRKMPEQYLWLHRRFKTRPQGEPPVYPKRRRRG